jgi:hypothetical protein
LTRLYLPALATLAIYLFPIVPLPYVKGGVVEAIVSYIPNAVLLVAAALMLFAALSLLQVSLVHAAERLRVVAKMPAPVRSNAQFRPEQVCVGDGHASTLARLLRT